MGVFGDVFDILAESAQLGAKAVKDTFMTQLVAAKPTPIVPKFNPSPYDALIDQSAKKYGIHPDFIKGMIQTESGFDHSKVSPRGAVGLMQIMPQTAKALKINPKIPAQNIEGGSKYITELIKKHDYNLEHALAAYNGGMGRFAKVGKDLNKMPEETQKYVPKVMGYFRGGNK